LGVITDFFWLRPALVDIPEDDGEIGSALGGRESPEYRFGGHDFFQFLEEKVTKVEFCLFSDRFCGLTCNA
jgi:hypothetical protein